MKSSGKGKERGGNKSHGISKKMKWTADEDAILVKRIEKYGTGNWSLIAQELSGRTGKQCRERWTNQLNPNLNKENWTQSEDRILLQQQQIYGNSWSKISMFLPGRSSNCVKNRWSWLSRHRVFTQHQAAQIQRARTHPVQQLQKQAAPVNQKLAALPVKQESSKNIDFVAMCQKSGETASDPFCIDDFAELLSSTGDILASEFEQPDLATLDLFDKGFSLWDSF